MSVFSRGTCHSFSVDSNDGKKLLTNFHKYFKFLIHIESILLINYLHDKTIIYWCTINAYISQVTCDPIAAKTQAEVMAVTNNTELTSECDTLASCQTDYCNSAESSWKSDTSLLIIVSSGLLIHFI